MSSSRVAVSCMNACIPNVEESWSMSSLKNPWEFSVSKNPVPSPNMFAEPLTACMKATFVLVKDMLLIFRKAMASGFFGEPTGTLWSGNS